MLRIFVFSIALHLAVYFVVQNIKSPLVPLQPPIKFKILKAPIANAGNKIPTSIRKSPPVVIVKAPKKRIVKEPIQKPSVALDQFMPSANWTPHRLEQENTPTTEESKYLKSTPNFPIAEGFEYRAEFANKHAGRLHELARRLLLEISLPEELAANCPLHRATLKLKQNGKIQKVKGSPYIRAFLNNKISEMLADPEFMLRLKQIDNDFVNISLVNELRAEPNKTREPWVTVQGMHITLHFESSASHAPGAIALVETAEKMASLFTNVLGIFTMLNPSDSYDLRLKKYHSLPGFAHPIK